MCLFMLNHPTDPVRKREPLVFAHSLTQFSPSMCQGATPGGEEKLGSRDHVVWPGMQPHPMTVRPQQDLGGGCEDVLGVRVRPAFREEVTKR